ncbi:MAG: hypothetical protein GX971_09240 [Firmicutes bacterium]|nr:hypothetical protein [Bacillota bacterium]
MQYIAAKFDMVGSRKLHRRSDVQKHFLLMAEDINVKFSDYLEAEFIVTHGDEAQVLLKASQAKWVFRMFEHLSISMAEVDLRCGVGLGTLSTDLQEISIGMDGEAWQNAKHAIDTAKKKRQTIGFFGFDSELQTHLNAIGNLLCHLQARWTKEQTETIRLLSQEHTQKEIAVLLGISQAAVSKRLTAAGWQHYYCGRESLEMLLERGLSPTRLT